MSTPAESFPDRVERIRKDHNVSIMTARRVAAAEARHEQALRDMRLKALADAMRQAHTDPQSTKGNS